MADAFENILGQPQVREFLRTVVETQRLSHAYLFTGPAGSNKTQAAFALAQALVCPQGPKGPRGGACGRCDACNKVRRRRHPDVHFYEPEGAYGYLVEQIREIVADTALAPIQSNRKIYILDRVDLLGTAAANAFLKTLEEPPEDVVMILLGRTTQAVLPTIVSRCQVVPFRHIPPQEAAGIVRQNTGAAMELAQVAIEACGGSITGAIEFLKAPGNERLQFRTEVLNILGALPLADDWDLITYGADLITRSKLPLDDVQSLQKQELEQNRDFLSSSSLRRLEDQQKRAFTARSLTYLRQLIAIMRSWLRDVMMVRVSAPELVINGDALKSIEAAAANCSVEGLLGALRSVDRCEEAISYNVSPETCIDVLLYQVREVLNGKNRTHTPSL